jgi:hypothetical protein
MTTTQIEVTESTQINEGVERYDFGLHDKTKAKKAVGCQIARAVFVIVGGLQPGSKVWKASSCHGHVRTYHPDGTYYVWLGRATRAGECYGPGQDWHYCTTEAQRQAEIDKYLKDSEARAKKNFSA